MPVLPFLCYSNSKGYLIYIYYKWVGGREAENFREVWNFSFCVFFVFLRKSLLRETAACPTVFMSWRHCPCHLWCPTHTSKPCSTSMGKRALVINKQAWVIRSNAILVNRKIQSHWTWLHDSSRLPWESWPKAKGERKPELRSPMWIAGLCLVWLWTQGFIHSRCAAQPPFLIPSASWIDVSKKRAIAHMGIYCSKGGCSFVMSS